MLALLSLAQQCRDHRDSIGFGAIHAGQFGQGGHYVLERGDMAAFSTRLDDTWPVGDCGNSNPTFIEIPFHTAELSVGIEELHIVPTFLVRAVVTGEYHERICFEAGLFQFVDNFLNVPVDISDHGGESFFRVWPILIGELAVGWHLHAFSATFVICVRNVQSVVEKKRFLLVAVDKLEYLFLAEVWNEVDLLFGNTRTSTNLAFFPPIFQHVSQRNFLAISDDEVGVAVMGMVHANIAVEVVEAVLVGVVESRSSHSPFADTSGAVSGLL